MLAETKMAKVPRFVFMEGGHRFGPRAGTLSDGMESALVYGFSNKHAYDLFRVNCPEALQPWHLVKSYLRLHTKAAENHLRLVVLDATGPRQPCLYAATMEAVLEAIEQEADQIAGLYCLILDSHTGTYSLENAA